MVAKGYRSAKSCGTQSTVGSLARLRAAMSSSEHSHVTCILVKYPVIRKRHSSYAKTWLEMQSLSHTHLRHFIGSQVHRQAATTTSGITPVRGMSKTLTYMYRVGAIKRHVRKVRLLYAMAAKS